MEDTTKEYTNGEVTVVWQPHKCIHSSNCWRGLPKAFKPAEKPWINLDNVNSDEIMEQVLKCPSGALSIKEQQVSETAALQEVLTTEIVVLKNGPIRVKGSLSIKHKDGRQETQKEVFLCRCGQSSNKPYCDGTHKKCGFTDE